MSDVAALIVYWNRWFLQDNATLTNELNARLDPMYRQPRRDVQTHDHRCAHTVIRKEAPLAKPMTIEIAVLVIIPSRELFGNRMRFTKLDAGRRAFAG